MHMMVQGGTCNTGEFVLIFGVRNLTFNQYLEFVHKNIGKNKKFGHWSIFGQYLEKFNIHAAYKISNRITKGVRTRMF